uniref:RanBP2-type domain-containing protein n=1 Tax=Strigamia maritima TaxID=126957 RepID=T1J3W4_STRMM
MATADLTKQLYRRLKQEFPEIPDSIIISCVNRYPNDPQTCISVLSQQSSTYMHIPMNELGLNKMDKDYYNHHETSRPYPIQQQHNQNLPYRYAGQKSYPGDLPMRRNTLTSTPMPSRGYQRPGTTPQSAPVVPNVYEPFQAEYRAKLAARSPIRGGPFMLPPHQQQQQQPAVYGNDYANQHYNQYNYEVALNYDQVGHQRAKMDRLQQKLNEDRLRLDSIRQQVSSMELKLYNRIKALKHPAIFNPDEMKRLREETRKLRVECDCMSREVDFLVKGQVPLGETSEDFYKHINPGQSGSVGTPPSSSGSINRRPSATPPLSSHQEHDDDRHQWSCSQCTFLNNPALYKCEICDMPRLASAADFEDDLKKR